MTDLLKKALKAHGGMARWQILQRLHAEIEFGGLAFAARGKWRGRRKRAVTVFLKAPRVVFADYPAPGRRGIFTAEQVSIIRDGATMIERSSPRRAFRAWRRQIWWDDLDLLYFAGYALWNYITTPFLLADKNVLTAEIAPWQEDNETWRRLAVTFPETIPTHCRKQIFYFDATFRLRRHDYTPDVYASWAKAAHYCRHYQYFSGLLIARERFVLPRNAAGKVSPRPRLVWIKIGNCTLE